MYGENWNTKQTELKLEMQELEGLVPVHIPDEIVEKIKFLCRRSPKDEWSGILLFSVEGSIRDIANMKITLQDILLMDIGNATYTDFDWDEDIVNYKMEHPEADNWILGHIHSHNTMRVFFSPTDMSELNDNSPNHNYYLSVIVNNYLDVTAKVAFIGNPISFVCKDELGKDYSVGVSNAKLKPIMFVHDCKIEMNVPEMQAPNGFEERFLLIQEKSAAKKEAEKSSFGTGKLIGEKSSYKEGGYGSNNDWDDDVIDLRKKNKNKGKSPGFDFKEYNKHKDKLSAEKDEEEWKTTIEDEFTAFVLRFGNEVEGDTVEDAIDDLAESTMDGEAIAGNILNGYGEWYDTFFKRIKKYHTAEAFIDMLYEVCVLMEDHEEEGNLDLAFIPTTVAGLRSMGNKMEESLNEKEKGGKGWD